MPPVLMSSTEAPTELPITGSGRVVDAHVVRCIQRQGNAGDALSVAISDELVFVDFELYQQFSQKLKVCTGSCPPAVIARTLTRPL